MLRRDLKSKWGEIPRKILNLVALGYGSVLRSFFYDVGFLEGFFVHYQGLADIGAIPVGNRVGISVEFPAVLKALANIVVELAGVWIGCCFVCVCFHVFCFMSPPSK